jgi:hypothetical protein
MTEPRPGPRPILPLLAAAVVLFALYARLASAGLPFGFGEPLDAPYNLLAQALCRGQLHLRVEPSPELFRLADPYEPGRNVHARLHDASLYHGRYYLYFGVVPAVLAFVPWRLAGLGDLPEPAVVVAFGIGAFVFSALLLVRLLRAHLTLPRAPVLFAAFLGLGLFDLVPFLLGSPNVYEVAITAGLFFSTAAAYFFTRAGDGGGLGTLALGGACLGLAVGCRPNLVVLVPILPLLSRGGDRPLAGDRGPEKRTSLRMALAAGLPLAAVVLLLALYNHARFDSWTEFGTAYQLIGARRISWFDYRVSPYVLYYLFLAPVALSLDFPHLLPYHSWPFAAPAPEGLFVDFRTTGVLVQAPFLLILFAAPLVLGRTPVRAPDVLKRRLGALVVAGLVLPLATSLVFASVAMRFEADFLTLLVVPALFLWLSLAASSVGRRRLLGVVGTLVFGWSLLVALALGVTGESDDLRRTNPALYASLERRFEPLRIALGRVFDPDGRATVRARVALPERLAAAEEPLVSWGTLDAYDVLWIASSAPGEWELRLDTAAERGTAGGAVSRAELRAAPGPFREIEIDIDRVRRRVRLRVDGGPALEMGGRLVGVQRNRIWLGRGPRGHDAPELRPFSGTLVPEAMWLAGPAGLESLPPVAAVPALLFGPDETPPERGETGQLRVKAGTAGADIFTDGGWRWIPRAFVDRVQASRRLAPGPAGAWEPLVVCAGAGEADGVFVRRAGGGRLAFRLARWTGSWRTHAESRAVPTAGGGLATATFDRPARLATVSLEGREVLRAEVDLLPLALPRITTGAVPAPLAPSPPLR